MRVGAYYAKRATEKATLFTSNSRKTAFFSKKAVLKFSKGFKRSFYSKVQIYPLKKYCPLMPILSFVLLGSVDRGD